MHTQSLRNERGVALILTVMLSLMVAGMAVGIILMMSNSNLIARFHAAEASMEMAADAGLERGRDMLNGNPALVPVGLGFATLETNQPVLDANGVVIPGFTRSLYAGENGDTTGQYGNFASVIAEIRNSRGAVVVRRMQLNQVPFSRYARFFNTWGAVMWGNTEVLNGPVHSNQGMALQTGAPGTAFNPPGPVTTVSGITNQGSGQWLSGAPTTVAAIPFPTLATLNNLQTLATAAQTSIVGYATLGATDPDTRVEFIAVDLNGDGLLTGGNEGYFRVFKANPAGAGTATERRAYVSARPWPTGGTGNDPNLLSPNCVGLANPGWPFPAAGPIHTAWTADSIYAKTAGGGGPKTTAVYTALTTNTGANAVAKGQCFLGGDRRLAPDSSWSVSDQYGDWLAWPGWAGAPPAALINYLGTLPNKIRAGTTATAVASTFWPLSRLQNNNFNGVIFVTGSVAVSGQVRGRVTLVATGNIMLADDIRYVTPPGSPNCDDILGMLTARDAVIEDNNLNTPFNVNGHWTVKFDESPDETFEAFMLTLGNFQGESFGGDPAVTAPENCAGKSRGCKSIHGGTIQQAVAATFTGNSGWAEQDTWDDCGLRSPPPYYPTTGRYIKNRYYEMDPVGFNAAAWFAANQ